VCDAAGTGLESGLYGYRIRVRDAAGGETSSQSGRMVLTR
jgi:hypothetical protein